MRDILRLLKNNRSRRCHDNQDFRDAQVGEEYLQTDFIDLFKPLLLSIQTFMMNSSDLFCKRKLRHGNKYYYYD